MKKRIKILQNLINASENIDRLEAELKQFPWDIDTPLITLTIEDIAYVLNKVKQGKMTLEALETWANVIECRDDIEFESEKELLAIHQLANPFLYSEDGLDSEKNMKKVVINLSTGLKKV